MTHRNVVDLGLVPIGNTYWRLAIDEAVCTQMLYDLAYPPSQMLAPPSTPLPAPLPPQDVPLPSTWPVVPVEKRRVDNGSFSIDHLMSPKKTSSRGEGTEVAGTLEKLLVVSHRQKRMENLEKIISRLRRTRLEQEAKMKRMKGDAARENRNARERERRAKVRATGKQRGLIG